MTYNKKGVNDEQHEFIIKTGMMADTCLKKGYMDAFRKKTIIFQYLVDNDLLLALFYAKYFKLPKNFIDELQTLFKIRRID